ncbi:MAG: carboxypeptidase regulatory-like domain-containing protein [Alphaproteobacteria bacterium]
MTRRYLWAVALAALSVAPDVCAGEAAKVGIVKGTVTVAGKPTADVVVSLEGVAPEIVKARISAAGPHKAVLEQKNMKFIPFVLPVLVGTTVDFPNYDKNWHNVYSKSEAKKFDLGLYAPGKSRSATFDRPGIVRILCNVHPSMEAFIVVKEHPFFTAADKSGNYRLDNVPLGKYRVQVWHPQFGITEAGVEIVRAGEVVDMNFDIKKK